MFLEIAGGKIELREARNLRSFKVVVKGKSCDLDEIRRTLAGKVVFSDDTTAWVAEEFLRRWPPLQDSAEWQRSLTGMIEKARPHGWIDEATGAIKAHLEWSDGTAETSGTELETLRDGLKQAMRRLAATVSIVTVNDDGVPHGMTATSVTSLTMDPPSIVICINNGASIHDPLLRARVFCVNLLCPDHEALCGDFSGKKAGKERFTAGQWALSEMAPPSLVDGQASVFCEVDGELAYGTHTIVVGRVTKVLVADGVAPLLHQNALFGRFEPLVSA